MARALLGSAHQSACLITCRQAATGDRPQRSRIECLARSLIFSPTEGSRMSLRGDGTAVGFIAGIVSFVALGYVEAHTIPALIEEVVFHGDPSAGFPLGFFVVG